ncbi:sensor histidine kinase [Bacillus salitolerans]|uniref:histidine kinase n=1 Tax=Bacillus salitolerans TaxID=1437434 RepID=A0ABW4LIE0_9BACI
MKGVSRSLSVFRIFVALICLGFITLFIANIPVYYERLATDCIYNECFAAPSPPPGTENLNEIGMNEKLFALFYTVLECVFIFIFLIAAALIFWKRSHELMGLLGTLLLVSFGISFASIISVPAENIPLLMQINDAMSFIGWGSLSVFFFLFPNGRFVPKWSMWIFFLTIGLLSLTYLENLPKWVVYFRILFIFGFLLYSQIYRFRTVSTQVERQQTKWVVYGFSVAISGFLCVVFIPLLFNPNIFEEGSIQYFMIFNSFVYFLLLLIPITLTFALLRRRLWDIDPLLNRTILYAIMVVVVISIYVAVVWYLSSMFNTNDNFIISIIATSIVAISFSPIKEKVQQMIIRRMYGEQGNPYFVVALLGKKIQESQTPEQVLDQVARTLKEVLRLPYTEIQLLQNNEAITLTHSGTKQEEVHPLPITYRGTKLGYLNVAPRSSGEAFTKSDEKLWEVLIQQLGPLLQDLKATMDLKAINRDLQHSREKLVLAREEERHYLRRNLHDDLAPRLAALAYTAAAAEDLVDKEPHIVKNLLIEHQKMILGTVDDIRRLVYDLRPPTIDELGLVEALRQRIHEITSIRKNHDSSIYLTYEAPSKLSDIPAAVEVAVYRIISESVVNVVRHSKARHCGVKIILTNNRLELEVMDDGIGISFKKEFISMGGLGLPSMKERASELGGELSIEQRKEGGTRIFAWIPISTNTTINMGGIK